MAASLNIFCLSLCLIIAVCIGIRITHNTYLGCFLDCEPNCFTRDINGLNGIVKLGYWTMVTGLPRVSHNAMTIELCSQICSQGSFKYIGLQFQSECFCGNSAMRQGNASESDCNSLCGGNTSQKCGGSDRNSVYSVTYPGGDWFISAPVTYVTVNNLFTQPLYWTVSATSLLNCVFNCNSGCEGVIFSQQQSQCYLLRFAAVPPALVNTTGEFFVRR